MVFRRDLVRQNAIRFLPDNIHEDNIFILELLLHAGQVIRIADRLYCRRLREGSIMTTFHPREDFASYLQNALRVLELDGMFAFPPRIRQVLGTIAANHFSYARTALQQDLPRADNDWPKGNGPCEYAFATILSRTRTEAEFQQKNQAIAKLDGKIALLGETIAHREQKIAELGEEITRRDQKIEVLGEQAVRRNTKIRLLGEQVVQQDKKIKLLEEKIARRGKKMESLAEAIVQRNKKIALLQKAVEAKRDRIDTLESSWSYRLGKGILAVPRFLVSLRHRD